MVGLPLIATYCPSGRSNDRLCNTKQHPAHLVSSSQLISSRYPIFVVLARPARCGRVVNDIKLVTVSNVFIFVSVVSTNISL